MFQTTWTKAIVMFSEVWLALSLGALITTKQGWCKKGGQLTMPIILLKTSYKTIAFIQVVSNYLNEGNSFIACFHKCDWLCHLATLIQLNKVGAQKGGQVTKPIILVKTCYKTIVFHSSSLKHLSIGDFLASWPQLISKLLVAHR